MMMLNNLLTATQKRLALFRIFIIATLLGLVLVIPAHAQTAADLKHDLDRLQQDLSDMQRYVYQGKEPAVMPDLSTGGPADNVSGQLQVQIQRLEQDLRKLNGRFEEVDHQISTIEGRLDRLITDVDYRLRTIESRLAGETGQNTTTSNLQSNLAYPAQKPTTALPSGTQNVTAGSNGTTIVSSQGTKVAEGGELLPGQQSLGQLTTEQMTAFANGNAPTQLQNTQPPTPAATTPPPTLEAAPSPAGVSSVSSAAPGTSAPLGATPQDQYNNAIDLLSKRDFDSAEVALRQFLDVNNNDPLAGNALYWLGETYYARENYRDATKVFAESYTKYPEGAKVTASLLKLAMSLEALNQVEVACTSYQTLLSEHKGARPRVLSIAEKAVVRLTCP